MIINHFTFGSVDILQINFSKSEILNPFLFFEDIMLKLMSEIIAALPCSCPNELICTSYGLIILTYDCLWLCQGIRE